MFLFFEQSYRSGLNRYCIFSGFALGLQLLSGEPQNTYYTCVFLMVYGAARYLLETTERSHRSLMRLTVRGIAIPLVALGVSAIQVLPTFEFYLFSDRAGNTFEFASFMSFPPRNFFTLLVPSPATDQIDPNWEFGTYFGVMAVVLTLFGAACSRHRDRVSSLVILLLLAIGVMLGRHTPLYHVLFDYFPGFSLFRVPARCSLILVFAAAALAGMGVQRLLHSPLSGREQLVALTIVGALA